MKNRRPRRSRRIPRVLLLAGGAALGIGLLWWAFPRLPRLPAITTPLRPAGSSPAANSAGSGALRPGVLIIIDDFGHNRAAAVPFLAFDRALAMAFLPGRPRTREIAEEAHRRGKSVMLHLPMEPLGYPARDPGEGCILTSQTAAEVARVLADDLAQVPFAEAVNNHEGSRATADGKLMEVVMRELHERGLAFVDSFTIPGSVTGPVAMRLGVRRLGRDVFIDNDRSSAGIRARMEELFREAEKRGWAVGIGHPYPETAEELAWMRGEADRRGIVFLDLSEALARADSRH